MTLSVKQKKILAFPNSKYDALICDGAVRSGKTSVMFATFVMWAMRDFDGQNFLIVGKTFGSAVRNVVIPAQAMTYWGEHGYTLAWRKSEGVLVVSRHNRTNFFYVFGAKDSSSYQLIQGITAAGLFVDETALCDKTAVEQAIARCSVDGSRFWFNCNPESSEHWFYKEWVARPESKNAVRLHFLMRDNPSLSDAVINRYERMFSGVFYKRYILGEWVLAEGLVYQFDLADICGEIEVSDRAAVWVSIDYGITNPTACIMWTVKNGTAYAIDEWGFDSRKEGYRLTNAKLYERMARWIGGRNVQEIVIDPSAAGFIEEMNEHGVYDVVKGNNDVTAGIQTVSRGLGNGGVKISPKCAGLLREMSLYRWDEKKSAREGRDVVVKDNDHYCDSMRYFLHTIGRDYVPKLNAD